MSHPVISVWVPRALGVAILGLLVWGGSLALRVVDEANGTVLQFTLDATSTMMWTAGIVSVTALVVVAVGLLGAKRS